MKSLFLLVFIALFNQLYAQIELKGYSYNWKPYLNAREQEKAKEMSKPTPLLTLAEINQVKTLFKQLEYPADSFYTQPKLQEMLTGILTSDEIILQKESENIWDIQYGTYSYPSIGFHQVTVYYHIFIDAQTHKVLPRWELSFIY
jgi:hypothetical protein